jgi:hypothetical protein
MGKGYILRARKTMSEEDQRAFDRWLKANAVVGLIFAAGIIAMAWAGSNSAGPRDTVLANKAKTPDVGIAASAQRGDQGSRLRSRRNVND